MAQQITDAISKQNSIWIIGNGGSASTAEHFETDLSFIRISMPFPKIKVSALTSNSALITAIANDIGYDDVFSFQLSMKGSAGNILVAISASGNSPNIVNAIKKAKELNMETIAFVGFDGGKAKELADYVLHVQEDNYGIVEDCHQSVEMIPNAIPQ
jgi:phosphoheptose isomerase